MMTTTVTTVTVRTLMSDEFKDRQFESSWGAGYASELIGMMQPNLAKE